MPPLLLIDAGNTRVKWTEASPHAPLTKLHHHGGMPSREVSLAKVQVLAKKHPSDYVVLACVVPKLISFFKKAFGRRLFIVTGDSAKLGLTFDYPNPSELGADRVAAAVAAHALGKWPVIIVSCGTATVFTVLNGKGALCGGAIAPGGQAQLDALLKTTAQLPATQLRVPKTGYLARNTGDAIRSGVMLTFQGGIRELIGQLGKAVSAQRRPHVIITGGNAGLVDPSITGRREPLLVFEGLRIIGARVFYPLAS